MFRKYQHLERLSSDETEGILSGTIYVFPKLDGANGSIWLENGEIHVATRRMHLSSKSKKDIENPFYKWAMSQDNIKRYLLDNPTHRLFGEWLIPHSIKYYNKDAWNKFYIFDVITEYNDNKFSYLAYEDYKLLLEKYSIDYIPLLGKYHTDDIPEDFTELLEKNKYLIDEVNQNNIGEGIVIKNYNFVNKYGRVTWAKIISSEFLAKKFNKEKKEKVEIEDEIAKKYITPAFCEKEFLKFKDAHGWKSEMIPRLLHTIYHEFIAEEAWNFIKAYKNPLIDFKKLQNYVFSEIKLNLTKYIF